MRASGWSLKGSSIALLRWTVMPNCGVAPSVSSARANTFQNERCWVPLTAAGERDQAFNLEDYNSLRLRVRGDGRTYLTSMRPDNFLIPPEQNQDLWQAQVRTSGNGEWEEVEVPPWARVCRVTEWLTCRRLNRLGSAMADSTGRLCDDPPRQGARVAW
eukprot:scaffold1439_cov404-Prasinococcus_capsulatus_cf.AAC.38